jgi:hypothetical protein
LFVASRQARCRGAIVTGLDGEGAGLTLRTDWAGGGDVGALNASSEEASKRWLGV